MARTRAKHDPQVGDALLYAPAWARMREPPAEDETASRNSPNGASASDPPPPEWLERSSPPRMPTGIGGPNIDPPRLPPCSEQVADSANEDLPRWSSSNVLPERLRRIRSEQTTRRIARLSLIIMVAGIATYALTVVTSRDRTALNPPPREPVTYESGLPPAAPDAVSADATAQADQMAMLHTPTAAETPARPNRRAVLQAPAVELKLPPEEIAMLLRRGRDLFKVGEITAARLVLRRAAEAGNLEAAFMLATTFDPIVLREVGVIGFAPDLKQALSWYEKASALGSEEAKRSIERLGRAGDRGSNATNSSTR